MQASKPTTTQEQDEKQAQREQQSDPASRPGGFKNDPNDPTNPNEVRERYLEKVDEKPQP